ncbi:MAG TPA: hydantoinase B/oxoprolinase family protein [Candidatus Dormibacteraeota bacterium]|nr:hydantoinase B/oxoprolinase family protein [Candidatus Dormibacteraeota bacterium]
MIAQRAADVVTVEVVRNALNSAADEMGANLARSAYTPIIYEMKDYSVAIFNAKFELLGQAPGLPIFLGALEDAVRLTVEHYGEESIRPGDVYLVNDSYLAGSHLNDVSVFTPMYFEGTLIGYAASKTHWLDIGAMEPSQTMAATEIWQEGYRLGPLRIVRAGRLNRELMELLELNSRLPNSVHGDFQAQMAACRTGEQRLVAIYERFGREVVESAVGQIFAQCERLDREAVAALPDGEWHAEGYLDNDGHGSDPVPIRLTVRIEGSDVYLDLSGSAPQTSGCLNCGFAQTISAARLAFKFLINPDVPASGGTFRCVHVTAPRRSLFAAEEPAACQYYGPHLNLLIDLFIKIMSGLLPEKVTGSQCADAMNVILDGLGGESGRWMMGESLAVGWGGGRALDGSSALVDYAGGDLKNFPVEVIEARYPVRIHGYGLVCDSGGPGRRRGGLAIVRDYEFFDDTTHVSLWFERKVTPPWGVFGGRAGMTPSIELLRPGEEPMHALKCSHLRAPAASRLRAMTGGGGGYGPPRDRERDLVASDLADGYISAAAALEAYGYRS